MKQLILISLFLCHSIGFAATPVENLSKKLNSFTTMTASFKQTLYGAKNKVSQKSRGTLALKRPGQFIWHTRFPNDQKLIANDNTVWIYDIDLEQATRQSMNTTNANSPAFFLTGDVSMLPKRYTITEKSSKEFELKAKQEDDMFQTITLSFKGGALTEMMVHTKLDQKSVFEFSRVKLNPSLAKNYFIFKAPRGVEVIKND